MTELEKLFHEQAEKNYYTLVKENPKLVDFTELLKVIYMTGWRHCICFCEEEVRKMKEEDGRS